ncbi:MAG: succinate--CoA ligase subunit alpha [Candidatus Latescibacteria bacterium]|nr:succinate--CoA ligase subunit alpha [Candidatus Latescibacterota bacterium]NIM22012.1 succinate--CoA ligase subunit alpha [Candidatus Latescibacterota bacterium]NIM66030.1 succinate--CoA ligase subunit alpha [Candidatus Latescibacterota bacterium]NIO02438.1 succinate--CoA ligase subunit alpha [Candidatus Latescibacterota bacterium]NIO29349.1 succinate--CoA ligase subunit alpha [Candidatus Latescibacterota bacterium]
MSVLVDSDIRLLVQGITGSAAQHHTKLMLEYGTRIVAGVRPGAGGQNVHGVPVFDTVADSVEATAANAAILFVPARAMKAAAFEALDAGIRLVVMVSEHVPVHDTMEIVAGAEIAGTDLIGPNTPGLIAPPARCKIGFVPSQYYMPGPVGVASRSGTLTYEIVSRLTLASIGQTTCVGVGGDAIVGTTFAKMIKLFEADPETEAILLIGEVGGSMEEEVADLVARGDITKPVVAYIAGRTAPEGKRMGHAGAIVASGRGSIKSKLAAFDAASIPVAAVPAEVVPLLRKQLDRT